MQLRWNTDHQRLEHLYAAGRHIPAPLQGEGLFLELGTRNGDTLRYLASHKDSPMRGLPWHGFDSFEGLPDDVEGSSGGNKATWTAGKYSLHGKLPSMTCCPNVVLHKGWFNETVPCFLSAEHHREPIAFAHMDADIYSSTRSVLDAIFSRCAHRNGTVFSFDELFGSYEQEQHEFRALQESSKLYGVEWRFITYAETKMSPYARAAVQVVEPSERCLREYKRARRGKEKLANVARDADGCAARARR